MASDLNFKVDLGDVDDDLRKEMAVQLELFGKGLPTMLRAVMRAEAEDVLPMMKKSPSRIAQHVIAHGLQGRLAKYAGEVNVELADNMEAALALADDMEAALAKKL